MNRQTEMQTGEEYGGGRREMTVKSLCEIWEASVRSSVKPSTYACYVTLIEKHIQAELGNMSAGKLTNRVILEFVREKQRQGLSAGTVRLLLFFAETHRSGGKGEGDMAGRRTQLPTAKAAFRREEYYGMGGFPQDPQLPSALQKEL